VPRKSATNCSTAAKSIVGEQQLVDLMAVNGTYVTVAMLLSLGAEFSPADKPLPFPEKSR